MKKYIAFILVAVLCSFISSSVHADAGPKPSLRVVMKNMPDIECYADLLIEGSSGSSDRGSFDEPKYNKMLVGKLKSYNVDGWRPAVVNDLYRINGDIICKVENGKCIMDYSYRVPSSFKLIVVTEEGKTIVSNEIKRRAFNSTVYFDFNSGEAVEGPLLISYILQFFTTCFLTLLIEGLVLLMFGFNLKENFRVFLFINISTQVLLTALVFFGMYSIGVLGALVIYFLIEIFIIVIEAVLFAIYLKNHTKLRRVCFSVFANIASFVLGIVIMSLLG
ncbi:MAG: hypothetical protein ACOZCL_19425 [Bacillota bacterium]